MNENEARSDLVLTQTSPLLLLLTSPHLHRKGCEVCIKTARQPPASLLIKGVFPQHTMFNSNDFANLLTHNTHELFTRSGAQSKNLLFNGLFNFFLRLPAVKSPGVRFLKLRKTSRAEEVFLKSVFCRLVLALTAN